MEKCFTRENNEKYSKTPVKISEGIVCRYSNDNYRLVLVGQSMCLDCVTEDLFTQSGVNFSNFVYWCFGCI